MALQYGTTRWTGLDSATRYHIVRQDDKTLTLCGAKVDWLFGKDERRKGWVLCKKCEAIAGPVIPAPTAYSYMVEVRVMDDPPGWSTTPARFATEAEALEAGAAHYGRFVVVKGWRVVQVAEAPTHSFFDGQVHLMTTGPYYVGEQGGQQA